VSWTDGDLIFLVALVLALVVPIVISVRAGRRWEPQRVPVTSWSEGRARGPKAPGYYPGLATGIASALVLPVLFQALGFPDVGVALVFVVLATSLVAHLVLKPEHDFFGSVAWGIVLGALVLPCLLGLLVLPVLALAGL
jgi:hypothetical protein